VIGTPDKDTDRGREESIREMNELLQELRVILPGVQVLFAFLLTVAFTRRFTELSSYQIDVYFTAPTSQHRLLWRQHVRSQRLRLGNAFLILGSLFLAVAVSCVVFLVADFVYGHTMAAVATALVGGGLLVLWYLVPLAQRLMK
jgi:Flp pilus assembly protein TadB